MFLLLIISYIIGSIPTGYWFAKYYFNIDVTKYGSGNIGASNVARLLGKRYFFLIFFLDAIKAGLFLSYVQALVYQDVYTLLLLAVALLVGNAYSIFLNFGGGKGVSTAFGIFAALAPINLTLFFMIVWAVVLGAFKRSDVASIGTVLLVTMLSSFSYFDVSYDFFVFLLFLSCWVLFRHKNNILNMFGMVKGN